MGNIFSGQQTLKITSNGKWIHLVEKAAYINVATVAFFYVQDQYDGKCIVLIRLDNSTSKNGESSYSAVDTITSKPMTDNQIKAFISALTDK